MSLSNVKKFISAGFDIMQWAVRNSNGIPYGATGSVSVGAAAELERLYGVKTADVSVPEADVVPITGDDGLLGSFLFATNKPIAFTAEVGEADLTFAARAQSMAPYAIGPYWALNFLLPDAPTFQDITLLLSSQAKAVETNQEGSGFHHVMLPFCNVFYLGTRFNERGEKVFRYSITTSKTRLFPWGKSLSLVTHLTEAYIGFEWFSENRATFGVYIDDGAAPSFQLARTPVDAQHCLFWRNGVGMTPTSVTPTTRAVALTAGSSGDRIAYAYEY